MISLSNKNRKIVSILISTILIVLFIFSANTLLAQEPPDEGFTPITTGGVPGLIDEGGGLPSMEEFLQGLFAFLVGLAAVLAIVQITVGGVQYMTSAASGSLEEAKSKIRMAIIGLLLILATYIILAQINPQLVVISI